MQIAILGPLEVRGEDGRALEVAGARLRTLLARLALDPGRAVATGTLAEAVWGEHLPAEATNALQTLVSRLRRALSAPAAIVQSPAGYRLDIAPDAVDAHRFLTLAKDGAAALRRNDPAAAAALLDDALALWRGPALDGTSLDEDARMLTERRTAAHLDRVAAAVDLGETGRVAELERLAKESPIDERVAGLHLRALAGEGRQADALLAYERLRERLADELGVDPSAELQQLHLQLLREPVVTTRRTNLKAQLTSFVGRDDEVARIGKSLEENRLVTLVGPGGAGKTRLASEAAERIVDTAPDGVWLVELAAVTAGADVPQAVLGAVASREIHVMERHAQLSARDTMTRLQDGLAGKRAVLLLDNCEHVIDASARLAEQLLGACPELRVLATSREPLGIVGETLLAVPPLTQPASTATASEALEYPAVRLFVDRAAAVSAGFVVDAATVGPVVEIVRRLDGLPLAIELAAARLRALPLADVAARLSDRFRLLTGGSRTALPRHRTLRAVVEWSWELLTEDERRLVECLAVFPAGVTVDSAVAVRPEGVDAADVPDLLAALVDKSLLQPVGDGHRTRMLETIREYGVEVLGERGESAAARVRHADHFAALLAEAEPHLTTAGQLPWFELITVERENILAALRYRADVGDAEGALRIAVSLAGFAMMLGEHSAVSSWMADALAVEGPDSDLRVVARAMYAINATAMGPLEHPGPDAALDGLAVALEHVDTSTIPLAALLRPAVAFFAHDEERTVRYLDDAMRDGDDWARAAAYMLRANLAENSGDVATMRADIQIALDQFRAIGERWGMASTLRSMASLRTMEGDLDGAAAAATEALALMQEMRSHDDEVFVYAGLADIALRRGDAEESRRYVDLARRTAENRQSGMESMFTLAVLGDLEHRLGFVDEGRAHIEEALARLGPSTGTHPAQNHMRSLVLGSAARIARADGDPALALERIREAFVAARSTEDLPIIAAVGVGCAAIAADGRDAAQMLGAAARLRGAADATAIDVRALTERLRSELGDDFDREYAKGRALTSQEAIARLDPAAD